MADDWLPDESTRIFIQIDQPPSTDLDNAQNHPPPEVIRLVEGLIPGVEIQPLFPGAPITNAPSEISNLFYVDLFGQSDDEIGQTVENLNSAITKLTSSTTGGKQYVLAYTPKSVEECVKPLAQGEAIDVVGAEFARGQGISGRGVDLAILEKVWNTAALGKTFFGKEFAPKSKVLVNCKGKVDLDFNTVHAMDGYSVLWAKCTFDASAIMGMIPDSGKIPVTTINDSCQEAWAEAILMALDHGLEPNRKLRRGDVLLLEGQYLHKGVKAPLELWEDVFNRKPVFDAIRAAVRRGVVVIQPMGNGNADLNGLFQPGVVDSSIDIDEQFRRNGNDSGAILVAASSVYDPDPQKKVEGKALEGTNYGDRADLHSWGQGMTTVHGMAYSDTSGAAAIIAGVAVLAQSAIKADPRGLAPLNGLEMRRVLKRSSLRSRPFPGIGWMPNLMKFLIEILPDIETYRNELI